MKYELYIKKPFTIKGKWITVEFFDNSLRLDGGGRTEEIPYSKITGIRMLDLSSKRLRSEDDKSVKIIIHGKENLVVLRWLKNEEVFDPFIRELHERTAGRDEIWFRRGSPAIFGLAVAASILLVGMVLLFSLTGGELEALRIPGVGGICLGVALTKAKPESYDPAEYAKNAKGTQSAAGTD